MRFPVMKARTWDARRVVDWSSLMVEPKLNGIRLVGKVTAKGTTFFTINGNALSMFTPLAGPLQRVMQHNVRKHGQVMVDAEVLSADGVFETIAGVIHMKDTVYEDGRLHVFFAMPWTKFRDGADTVTQAQRIEEMDAHCDFRVFGNGIVKRVPSTYVTSATHIETAFECYLDEGYEGAMAKQMHTRYGGRRSYDWMKLKEEQSIDVRVISMKEGKGKYVGMVGALIIEHNGRTVDVGGMTDEQRATWWTKPQRIVGRMIEVVYQHETTKGSLRHPRFKRLRPDKE